MIIQTGMRTDIPAFYSQWLLNRIEAGFVLVRNPYNPSQVTRYSLSPQVVDLMAFCTKNPAPMLPHLDLLRPYGQYWFVTITPYGKDIEPRVPDKEQVMEDFKRLSQAVGVDSIGWRYDPILLYGPYTPEYHIKTFAQIAEDLAGYTKTCVISFIDIYKKVARNFPGVRAVSTRQRLQIGKAFAEIAAANGMTLRPCAEGNDLAQFGADCSGCMTVATYETALHAHLKVPRRSQNQRGKQCAWNFERGSRMKHKILETKNQVKLQLYEAYLTRQAIPYKKRYTPISGGYCLYVDKANLSRIDGKEALGDLYGSVEKSYFGITDCPNEKK